MESGNTTFPTPSIFTMRFIGVSLLAFPESASESTNQQEQPFSDLDRRCVLHLGFGIPLLQCVVGFPKPRCNTHLRSKSEKGDRKSTRLNSSHRTTSYAVFCLKKKK